MSGTLVRRGFVFFASRRAAPLLGCMDKAAIGRIRDRKTELAARIGAA